MTRFLDTLRDAWRRVAGSLRRDDVGGRLDEEFRFHVDMQTERNVALGMAPAEARRAALVAFGGRARFAEEAREETRSPLLEELARDVRQAARSLRRAPGFTTAAVLSFALGLGAATVVFSIVDHVVLRPLAYRDASRLVVVREVVGELAATYPSMPANASHFLEWQRSCRACEEMAAVARTEVTLRGDGDPQRLAALRVSHDLFGLLGARMQIGRGFTADEEELGHGRVVVLSDGFWRRQFGADPSIVGRSITLGSTPFPVVGVLAPSFSLPKGHELGELTNLPRDVDVYLPLALSPEERTTHGQFDYIVLARLRSGVSVAAARAELGAIERRIAESEPGRSSLDAVVVPLEESVVGAAGRPLLLLLGAVVAVLLVVCVNLANLSLARQAARARESAVRVALGAGQGRLVRYVLAESVLLALAGGVAGVVAAVGGLRSLLATAPATLPRLDEIRLDARVLAVSFAIAVVGGLSFGLLPALRAGRVDPGESLKEGSRTTTDGRGGRVFVAAQVGLSTLLLVAAGLFLASFVRVLRVDRGFTAEHLLAMDVSPPAARYRDGVSRLQLYDQALARLAALPGVSGAALTNRMPLEGETWVDGIRASGGSSDDGSAGGSANEVQANFRFVSPSYFPALGTRVIRGRVFTNADRGRHVVVLSERAARSLWPGRNPIGRQMRAGRDTAVEVVGVVPDVKTTSLETDGALIAYLPYWNWGGALPFATLVVRTSGEASALAGASRAALREVDPTMAVARVRTMDEIVSDATASRRFQLALLALFAIMALATASVGIYGVLSHSLARRTREIGVRIALGARPADVRRLALREGLTPVAVGLAAGLVAAVAAGRLFASLLFEVQPGDPATLAGVVALLGGVAVVACWIPARRAAATDPAGMLRVG